MKPREILITNDDGRLCDIAPTMLALLGVPQPEAMTGESREGFWRPRLGRPMRSCINARPHLG